MTMFKIANPEHFMRAMIRTIAKENKKDLVGCEIGVSRGENSKRLLKTLSIKKLYLVDPWIEYEEDNVKVSYENCEKIARKRLKPWSDKVVIIKGYSIGVAKHIPNNLDFVYIDGNHQYEYVKQDIELYYPKVKKGGIIGGDDFCGNQIGVIRAVLEFVDKNNLKLHSRINDWWIVK